MLSSVGLTAEGVRARIRAIGSTAEVASNGYGPSMHNILRLACHKAEALGHREIESEHFVLGLLDRVDGPAMSLFLHFGVDTERVKSLLLERMSGTAA